MWFTCVSVILIAHLTFTLLFIAPYFRSLSLSTKPISNTIFMSAENLLKSVHHSGWQAKGPNLLNPIKYPRLDPVWKSDSLSLIISLNYRLSSGNLCKRSSLSLTQLILSLDFVAQLRASIRADHSGSHPARFLPDFSKATDCHLRLLSRCQLDDFPS